jgi:hypothetical protein
MSANAIRLARGALRLPKSDSADSTNSDSAAMLAKEELAADLAIWNFRG